MSKYCEKCGREISEDDFLCPYCGAIWGDRIYSVGRDLSNVEEDTEDTLQQESHTECSEPSPAENVTVPKRWNWNNVWMAGAVVVAVILFIILIGPKDQEDEPTISTTPTTTVDGPTLPVTISTRPVAPQPSVITMRQYTVQVIDQYGHPIAGVRVKYENPLASVVITVTDSEGVASFIAFPDQANVCILDVPEGYSQSQIGIEYPFVENSTSLVIIVQKNSGDE